MKRFFAKIFARNYGKKIILGTLDDCPINPATQRIILKIVRFILMGLSLLDVNKKNMDVGSFFQNVRPKV